MVKENQNLEDSESLSSAGLCLHYAYEFLDPFMHILIFHPLGFKAIFIGGCLSQTLSKNKFTEFLQQCMKNKLLLAYKWLSTMCRKNM